MSFSMMVSWLSFYTIGLQGLYAEKKYLFLFCVFEPWVLRSSEIFCGIYIFIDTWLSNKVQMCKDEKTQLFADCPSLRSVVQCTEQHSCCNV